MKTLHLLRHAKSDWGTGQADFDRPLNERGRAAARRMGRELAREGIGLILCSPAKRTRETLELLNLDVPVRFEPRIYETSIPELVAVIEDIDDAVQSALVVGHMPAIAGAALALTHGDDGEARVRLGRHYPTAGWAKIELIADQWADIMGARGRVVRFTVPKELD